MKNNQNLRLLSVKKKNKNLKIRKLTLNHHKVIQNPLNE